MPLNIDWRQILLHLLNFAILASGLYFLLYRPVKDFMAKRERHYRDIDERAEKTLRDAEAYKQTYEDKLNAAEDEIAHLRAKASDELEEEKQRQLADARAQARRILETAGRTADLRAKKALADSNHELRSLAVEAVEKLLINDGDVLDRFLDAAESGTRDE